MRKNSLCKRSNPANIQLSRSTSLHTPGLIIFNIFAKNETTQMFVATRNQNYCLSFDTTYYGSSLQCVVRLNVED